jgi:carboxylate-amine ligase
MICASSPFVGGKLHPFPSNRLKFYEGNQKKIFSITGHVIPELVFTFADYEKVLKAMYLEIAPFDPDKILQYPWLNSRGAIPKFDYGCIEIRIADIQECPRMDLSIALFMEELIKSLVTEVQMDYRDQQNVSTEILKHVYDLANSFSLVEIPKDYLKIWKLTGRTKMELISELYLRVKSSLPEFARTSLEEWLTLGPLSERMKISYNKGVSLKEIYLELTRCLNEDRLFRY